MHERRPRPLAAGLPMHPPERNHLMLVVAFSLLMGIFMSPYVQPGGWAWALLPMGLLLSWLLHKSRRSPALAVAVIVCAVAMLWTQLWLYPAMPAEGTYAISGRVYGAPMVRTEKRMTFLISDICLGDESGGSGSAGDGIGKAYCTLYTYGDEPLPELFDGAEIRFTGRVYHPSGKNGPHGFDFRMWLLQSRISYGITSVCDLEIVNTPDTARWNDWADRARTAMRQQLTKTMGPQARIAMAMLVSDKEGLAQDELEAFQKAGIAHIMAVSGLHVSIAGAALVWLLGRMRVSRGWQMVVLGAFLSGYAALAGFSASSIRAAVMLLIGLLGRRLGRRSDPLITLSTAMTVVLLINPLQLFSASFVLSFSAMAGILLLQPVILSGLGGSIHERWRREKAAPWYLSQGRVQWERALSSFKELLSVTLAAQIGVLLPTACYFHQWPLYSVFINLMIIPLVGVLLPFLFVVLAVSWIPFVGMLVGQVGGLACDMLLWLTSMVAHLPYATLRVPSIPGSLLVALASCAVLASQYFRGPAGTRLLAIVLTMAIGLGGAFMAQPPKLRYIQLSAGQADAALIMDGRTTLAVDVGEFGTEALGYLLAEGRDLDAVFLTHLHLDHALGMNGLLDAGIRIGRVYLPEGGTEQQIGKEAKALLDRLDVEGIPVETLAAGDEVRYNTIGIEALWPMAGKVRTMQDANHQALVLRIGFGGFTVLAASDLSGRYEGYAAVPCDVLKVAHHGSADSTYEGFLEAASPGVALISCAFGDRALPSQATLHRLSSRNIPIFRTDETGDITLTVQKGQLLITPYKKR